MADIIYFGEIEKFAGSAGSFGPPAMRHSSISETRNIYPLFFKSNDQVENTEIGIPSEVLNGFVLSLSSPPWSVTGMPLTQQQADMAMGGDPLLHGETVFVVPATDSNHIILSLLCPEHQQLLLWPHTSHKRHYVRVHCPLQ